MTRPFVSVIIPTFNRAASVRAAVESALSQHVQEIEILVVDDASTDATRDVVRGMADGRVHLLARPLNGGAAAARNTGLRAARGEWIAFLDSDDVWLSGKLPQQLKALTKAPHDTLVSCTGVELHLLDHGVIRSMPIVEPADWARCLAMDCNLSPGSTQVAHRRLFDTIGPLDETLLRFEDWDWLLRYTRRGRIAAIPQPLAVVYNRRARLSAVVDSAARRFLTKHEATFDALRPSDRRRAKADLWLQVTGTYAFEGHLRGALPSACAALRQRPLHATARLAMGAVHVLRGRMAAARSRSLQASTAVTEPRGS